MQLSNINPVMKMALLPFVNEFKAQTEVLKKTLRDYPTTIELERRIDFCLSEIEENPSNGGLVENMEKEIVLLQDAKAYICVTCNGTGSVWAGIDYIPRETDIDDNKTCPDCYGVGNTL